MWFKPQGLGGANGGQAGQAWCGVPTGEPSPHTANLCGRLQKAASPNLLLRAPAISAQDLAVEV